MNNTFPKRLFSSKEYHLMGEVGIFNHFEKVELINGTIFQKQKESPLHASTCRRLNLSFFQILGEKTIISCKNPILINEHSEPEPDVALVRKPLSKYELQHPTGEDIYLIVEVANSSLEYDQEIKLPLYASANVPECWIVNLEKGILEQYSEPSSGIYKLKRILRSGDAIKMESFDISIEVSQILGK